MMDKNEVLIPATKDEINNDPKIAKNEEEIVYRSLSFVTFSVMSTLAICLVFAPNLLDHIEDYFPNQHIPSDRKQLFEHGLSLAAFGTFIFRFGHNIFFASLLPRYRYCIALITAICGMMVLILSFFIFKTQQLWWVYIAYAFFGVCFGCNEPNLFRSTSYLGNKTAKWIFYGLGVGFNGTMIVGLFAISCGLPLIWMYIFIVICLLISIVLYLNILNHHDKIIKNSNLKQKIINKTAKSMDNELGWNEFKIQMREWRKWFYIVLPFAIIEMINYFMLNCFSMIPFYIMQKGKIPVINHTYNLWISRNLLFSLSGFLWIFGSLLSYKIIDDSTKIRNLILNYPFIIIFIHIFGAIFCSCIFFIQPILAVIGSSIVNFAFGFIYKTAVIYVEQKIDSKYVLISLSVLFMFADIGAIIGTNSWQPIVELVCNNTTQSYYCDNS